MASLWGLQKRLQSYPIEVATSWPSGLADNHSEITHDKPCPTIEGSQVFDELYEFSNDY
jgi:hypothetical protein